MCNKITPIRYISYDMNRIIIVYNYIDYNCLISLKRSHHELSENSNIKNISMASWSQLETKKGI